MSEEHIRKYSYTITLGGEVGQKYELWYENCERARARTNKHN